MTAELTAQLESALSGRYRIDHELGRGGMGVVFLADDLRHGRPVAIKVMRPELVGSLSAERFNREITMVARLVHPGIVPVHDSGQAGDALFFVMPFIEGPSLRDVLKREGQLPIDRALAIVRDIGEALTFAHDRGIVHRDIKPANVLLGGDRPLIADFGLALATESADVRLSQSFAVGTPEYMSPEQGSPRAVVDGRADQYALACLLFEMLAGEPPVTGPNAQAVLARKVFGEVKGLRVVRPNAPQAVADAIGRALQPVPADRFASVKDFVAALHAPARGFWNVRRVALASAVGVIAIGAATIAATRVAPGLDGELIVVSPFENHTGDPRLDPIGPMVADWVTDGLHDMRTVRVVSTPTAQGAAHFVNTVVRRDGGDPLARLGEATGAGVVISGRYYLEGGRLTFRAQVSDIVGRSLLRSKSTAAALRASTGPITGSAANASEAFPAVRSRVMGLVAVAGEEDLTRRELEEQPPNYEAYLRFTQGMALYVAEDTMPAARAFLDAYRQDTTFATALLYAALNYSNARQYSVEDSLLQIVAQSEKQLSAYHRRWLEYRRAFLDGDRPRALRAIRMLAADAPRSKAVYNLGIEAWENGHLEEAVRALESLDQNAGPMQGFQHYWGALANIHHLLGNFDDALTSARNARRADPASWRAMGWEISALAALGRTEEVMTRAAPLAHASMDDNNWSPAEALREIAEELRAHGDRARADSVWRLALVWYRSAERGSMLTRDRLGLGHTLYALERFAEADTVAERLRREFPTDIGVLGLVGAVAARQRDTVRAEQMMATLAAVNLRYQLGRPTFQRAVIAAALDDHQRAMGLLREARQQGRSFQMWVHREPAFEALRELPEYRSLLSPVALRPAR